MVISVGNLSMGGTGKTPMVEHLIRMLKDKYQLATLSRGYKRKTYGFRIASGNDTAKTIGDEPYQFFIKYGNEIKVTVSEDRIYAIPNIMFEFPKTQIVILDDGFQQRGVIPDLSILLTEYEKPFYKDWIIPTGDLRESRSGAMRADVIVVTKCPPDLSSEQMATIQDQIQKYAPEKPVFFSYIKYLDPLPVLNEMDSNIADEIVLFSGLANSDPLEEYAKSKFDVKECVVYPDHHNYSLKEVKNLIDLREQNPGVSLLTTEKDRAKLLSSQFYSLIKEVPVFYIPIEIDFIGSGPKFDKVILDAVKRNEFT